LESDIDATRASLMDALIERRSKKRAKCPRLPANPRLRMRVAQQSIGQDFEGRKGAQVRVFRPVRHTHAVTPSFSTTQSCERAF
jgi:hypothetical protein